MAAPFPARVSTPAPKVTREKFCPKCKRMRPIDKFWKLKANRDGYQNRCKECFYEHRWKADGLYMASGKLAAGHRKNHFRIKYGITIKQLEEMSEAQGGRCFLCGRKPDELPARHNTLNVDHCHKTGRIRGLLCWNCNSGLGLLQDDPDLMLRAALYLMEGGE